MLKQGKLHLYLKVFKCIEYKLVTVILFFKIKKKQLKFSNEAVIKSLGNLARFLSSADCFLNLFKNTLSSTCQTVWIQIGPSKSLDLDRARRFAGLNLAQNCLQKLSANNSRM